MEVSSHCAERASFEQVFVEHAPFAWRVLRRFGVAESDVADACQDAFLIVHRKLHEFEGRSHLRTWLYRICARVASDYRKRAHRRYETEPLSREPAIADDQLRAAELTELCALLEHTLDALDDDKRRVFVLYELEDLPMTQVAELLGCPLKTAFSRLYVARDRVNAALRRAGCAALVVALDPFPMRSLAQPPLAAALNASGIATPSAAQLSTQLTALLSANAHKFASTSASALPAWLSTGVLTVAATAALTYAVTATSTAPVTAVSKAAPLASRAAPPMDEPRIDKPIAKAPAAKAPAAKAPVATASGPVVSPPRTRTPRLAERHVTPRIARPPSPVAARPDPNARPASAQWIEAPSSTLPNAVSSTGVPGTGLDEVLSATSIRPLMRVGPSVDEDYADKQWRLLPASATTARR